MSQQASMQFGPWQTFLGKPKKDKVTVEAGTGFYTGAQKDVLTCGSLPVDTEGAPGGFLVTPVVMSGGAGNDTYKFGSDQYEWAFISDAGGGKDTIKFNQSQPFHPDYYDLGIRIDTILINKRDVLMISTDLADGGRTNGIVFADPFGRLSKDNKLEKVKFGKKSFSFKKFFNSMKKSSKSNQEYSEIYSFSEATYSQLGSAGVLNIEGIDDLTSLDDGSYIGIASYNNALVDGMLG
jgi:hypothetical protein